MPARTNPPHVIGITGTIGSGKSTVGKILSGRGIPVLDTDLIVHDLLRLDTTIRRAVIDRFGHAVVDDPTSDAINRAALGQIVFADEKARKDLEAIVHPAVIMECRRRIKELKNQAVIAVLAPLLFEAGLQSEYNEIWTIYSSPEVLKQRLAARDNLSDAQIDARMQAQWSQEKKASLANLVIDNSGTYENTSKQVDTVLSKLIDRKPAT